MSEGKNIVYKGLEGDLRGQGEYEETIVSDLKNKIGEILTLAKTPQEAKTLVRQVLIDNMEQGPYTDPNITWNQEGKKVFITAELERIQIDTNGNRYPVKIIAVQVVDLKPVTKKHATIKKRFIN